MSGGSYDYLYTKTIEVPSDFRQMVDDMKEYPALHGYLQSILKKIEDLQISFSNNSKLFHDIEWYVSGDIGEKQMMETFLKTLQGKVSGQ